MWDIRVPKANVQSGHNSIALIAAVAALFSMESLAQSTNATIESALKVSEAMVCSATPRRNEVGPRNADDLEKVRKYAAAGNESCLLVLARWSERGEGIPVDYEAAMRMYREVSPRRSEGLVGIGRLYEAGLGVAKSESDALAHYMKAVDRGSPEGAVALGKMYESGRGVDVSLSKAAALYRLAIAKNDAEACLALNQLQAAHGVLAKEEIAEDFVRWRTSVQRQAARLAETAHRHVDIKKSAELELDLVFPRGSNAVTVRVAKSSGDEELDRGLAHLYARVSACPPAGYEPQLDAIVTRLPLRVSPQ